jgi:hypothetical protein
MLVSWNVYSNGIIIIVEFEGFVRSIYMFFLNSYNFDFSLSMYFFCNHFFFFFSFSNLDILGLFVLKLD